jgi:ATP-dependent Clp endopeptidase proteolytic subunit ClpP
MSRPQATIAFIPFRNHSGQPSVERTPLVPRLKNDTPDSWYRIEAKKKSDATVEADVYIMDEIGYWGVTANDFIKELTALDASSINVHINSPGGEVFDGVAIYNALRMHSAKVTCVVNGLAASAASFIAQAGDEVVVLKGSTMMIHDASAFAWGNAQEMRDTADILDKISNNIADIYATRAGGTLESWRAIMKDEMWYTADEAVEAGLADEVREPQKDEETATDSWDLRVYNFAGRNAAGDPISRMAAIKNKVEKETEMPPKAQKSTAPVATENADKDENEDDEETTETEKVIVEGEPVESDEDESGDEGDESEDDDDEEEEEDEVSAQNTLATGFLVNGVRVTDPKAVQRHIATLENAAKETTSANRRTFVRALAEGNNPKILASQIPSFEELVDSMTDRQYELWSASWDAAPSASLLQAHTSGGGGQQAP